MGVRFLYSITQARVATANRPFEPLTLSRVTQFKSSSRLAVAMEKMRDSKLVRMVDKLQVSGAEPGLTHAQLMLTNFDLKPGTYPQQMASVWISATR